MYTGSWSRQLNAYGSRTAPVSVVTGLERLCAAVVFGVPIALYLVFVLLVLIVCF